MSIRCITDSNGECTLKNVREGKHTLTATKDGYMDYTTEITVNDTELDLDIKIQKIPTFDVHIDVQDTKNQPVANATVELNGETRKTGSAGGCNFTAVRQGEYPIKITTEGYEDYTDTINVSEASTSFTFRITKIVPKYGIAVIALNDEETPIQNATVKVDDRTKSTNATGVCVFSEIPEGEHQLTISHADYQGITETITVDSTHTEFVRQLSDKVAPSVTITVHGTNNVPIQDASVTFNEITKNTNASGEASFANIKHGTHTVTITKTDYQDYTGEVTVTDETHTFTIRITEIPKHKVIVMALSEYDDTFIENATVKLDGLTRSTDSMGMCTYSSVKEGGHILTISHPEYKEKTGTITVDSSHTKFTWQLTPLQKYDISIQVISGGSGMVVDPAIGAKVLLDNETEQITDDMGMAYFNGVYEGSHTVQVVFEGYSPHAETVVVSDEDTYFRIRLS